LLALLRVNTGASYEKQPLRVILECTPDNIILDLKILIQEVSLPTRIGMDSTHQGGTQEHILRMLAPKKPIDLELVSQIHLPVGS
jgi:hypothetical protein